MKIIVELEPENPGGAKELTITPTENYNFVSIELDGHFYDVVVADLHRALLPFMDKRYEEMSQD